MAQKRITDLVAASTIVGEELLEVAQLSTTVAMTATTLSAQASDNSFNDSAAQFIAEGFAVADRVKVKGFTGNVANNILVGTITALTAGKMTIGGTDGDVIVDDAAGESVTIAKWTSKRVGVSDVGGSALEVLESGASIDAAVTKIDFVGGATVVQTAPGEVEVTAGGGGGGGGGSAVNAVGAHRYWRISDIGTSSAGQAVACSEIRLRSTVGGADLAVSAGRCIEQNGSFPIANTYDGNINTLWGVAGSANTPLCVIVYDMGSAVDVREVAVTARNDSFYGQAPRSFTLAWSDDDEFYTEVGQLEFGTFASAAQVRTAEVPVSYAYGNVAGLSTVQTEVADYTLAANDVRNYIRMTAAGTKNVNISTNATTALPAAGEWTIRNVGAGDLTIVPAGGVTVNAPAGGSLLLGQKMTAMLKRVAVDEFDLIGQTL